MKTVKALFSSFRNVFISILCAIVVLAAVGIGIALAAGAGKPEEVMDRNAALEYAFGDAGVQASEVTITKQKLEKENGKQHYDIEFYDSKYTYEYEIDAFTGAVTGVDIQARNLASLPEAGAVTTPGQTGQQGQGNQTGQSGQQSQGDQTGQAGQQGQGDQTGESGQQSQGDQTGQAGQEGQNGQQGQGGQTGQASQPDQSGRIGQDAAKAAALADAGVRESDVTVIKCKLDLENGVEVYDVEFCSADTEYDYEIGALDGAILGKEQKSLGQSQASGGQPGQNGQIDMETAKATALSDAGVNASDAVFTKSELDWDDGVAVYEFKFRTSSAEYEYEINAMNGAVLNREMETFGKHDPVSGAEGENASAYIGVDQAKAVALAHGGFGADEVVFTKAKLEREHGRVHYEIEFYKDLMEYEYSIDAYTGDILEYESEYDD